MRQLLTTTHFCKRSLAALFYAFFLLSAPLFSEQDLSCETELGSQNTDPTVGKKVRSTFLESLDKMLALAFDPQARIFQLDQAKPKQIFRTDEKGFREFVKTYGYFSDEKPIVGRVTKEYADTCVAAELLQLVLKTIRDPLQLEIAIGEVTAKILAYRDLKEGQMLSLPRLDNTGHPVFFTYKVDQVFDLWHKMPAFGLVPQEKGVSALLLFRGTDFTLVTERGWASLISDLEIRDPGYYAFIQAKPMLRAWLKKMADQGKHAHVMGFSLGGVFTLYTVLHAYDLLSKKSNEPTLAFNLPGVSREIIDEWKEIPASELPPLKLFVNRGDLVSKLGKLLGNVYELSLPTLSKPLYAHTAIMSLEPLYFLQAIDLEKENAKRSD